MFGAIAPSHNKRAAGTDLQALEKEIMPHRSTKRQANEQSEEQKSEADMDSGSERDEEQIIKQVEELIRVKDVENSTLKLGYNESDYQITSQQYPNCLWEHISPTGWQPNEKWVKPKKMEKTYKFTLDKFQEKAVECIQKNESVLVAAHTSAGKTAIAEYAIAKSLNNN